MRFQLFSLVVLLCGCVVAADEITLERFPDADSVLVDEHERVSYNPDGTYESVSETWTKILTERGRREERQIGTGYNARYGKAAIEYVGIIGSNGVERVVDCSATTKEMTDNSSLAVNIVDPLDRRIVCTVPELRIGDVLHVRMRRTATKSRVENQWSDVSILEWNRPIIRSVFEVKAPAGLPIRKKGIRHPLGNIREESRKLKDGSMLYVFTCTNSPRMFPEPDMPPMWTQVQNVRLSTASDWKELSRWYWNLCVPHLEKTNAGMTNKVAQLGHDIKAIFRFVSQEIRYMGLTLEDTSPGYAPHDVCLTFDNRYGVCRDKAGLLVAMLRMAGFKAFPVLINVGAKMDPEVPQPYFNHAIVAVEQDKGERYMLMDPTNESTKDIFPSYLCDKSYLVARPEGEDLRTSPVPPAANNSVAIDTTGRLSRDGAMVIETTLDFKGINDTAYRGALLRKRAEERRLVFERVLKGVQSGAELVSFELTPADLRDTSKPIKVRFTARLPETILRGKTIDALSVPLLSTSFSIANILLDGSTSLEKRRYPLVLTTTAGVREKLSLDLGDALGEVSALPPDACETNGYVYARTFRMEDGKLVVKRSLDIDRVEFSPEEYLELREKIKRVEAAERRRPQFVSENLKGADVRWILGETSVDILSDSSWVVTNRDVQEVLTYRGKKDNAEISLSMHPSWRNVRVVSATVSNLNGIVSKVSPHEMNVIDCGWAASAPRYPAGKTLVVNLPAVEIGSVISVVTETVVTNAPTSYYASFRFDSREPMVRRKVRVNDWVRDVRKPRRIPDEPSQAPANYWRDEMTISSNSFAKAAERLVRAVDVEEIGVWPEGAPETDDDLEIVRVLRNWMDREIRVCGPTLYEIPLDQQLTPPEVVLKERYATRLDYIRTLTSMLRGAGIEADIVFAAANASESAQERYRDKFEKPHVRAFAHALCRVRLHEGGFLGFGGTTREYFIGTENEFTPLGATAFEGADYFDPMTCEFGIVTVPDKTLSAGVVEETRITLRADGSADLDLVHLLTGYGVGGFRRRYVEMLPEDRSRHYQTLLGNVAQSATATRELETDVKSYPATLKFSCYIPHYATVEKDVMTLQFAEMDNPFPALPGGVRETPFEIGGDSPTLERVIVRFPEGYKTIEHLPESLTLDDPCEKGRRRLTTRVSQTVREGCLEVTVEREIPRGPDAVYAPSYAELIRDWHSRARARAGRTIVVRK